MYQNPQIAIAIAEGNKVSDEDLKQAITQFEDFYEEVFLELTKHGEIKDMIVCDNLGDHLIGNVYIKFASEEQAESAMKSLSGKYYSGKPIVGEYSPVTDFRESRCRQFEKGSCDRGGFCNFMHLKYISKKFKNSLIDQMYDEHPEFKKRHRSSSRDKKKKSRRDEDSDDDRILIFNILVGDRNSEERRYIISKWTKRFEQDKEDEVKRREKAEAQINLLFLEQKLKEKFNTAEKEVADNQL
jgi:splicing factor U2AF subunit